MEREADWGDIEKILNHHECIEDKCLNPSCKILWLKKILKSKTCVKCGKYAMGGDKCGECNTAVCEECIYFYYKYLCEECYNRKKNK